jgi:hypothetical protein
VVSSSPAATSRIATSTTLPPNPTFGSHEWLMNSITASYSSSVSATRWRSSVIWTAEFCSRSGSARSCSSGTVWPPLTATTSPSAIGATATSPRPAMPLGSPLTALGVIHVLTAAAMPVSLAAQVIQSGNAPVPRPGVRRGVRPVPSGRTT